MLRRYSGDEVFVSIFGAIVQGFGIGDFVTIVWDGEDFIMTPGHHGEVMVALTPNEISSVTLTLMQGSPANGILNALFNSARQLGIGGGPIEVNDFNGLAVYSCPTAFQKKHPDTGFSTAVGTRAYAFACANARLIDAITSDGFRGQKKN